MLSGLDLDRKKAVYLGMAGVTVLVMAFFLIYYSFLYEKTYTAYTLTEISKIRENSVESCDLDGKILRTSPDGAELCDSRMNSLVKLAFEMKRPETLVNDAFALVMDRGGREALIIEADGTNAMLKTPGVITGGAISGQGQAAFLLEGRQSVYLVNMEGEEAEGPPLSSSKTALALCFAGTGKTLAVSELGLELGDPVSAISFYNINGEPIKTGEMTYKGSLIPALFPLSGGRILALGDDCLSVIRADAAPKEIYAEKPEGKIRKAVSGGGRAALLIENEERVCKVYVYDRGGKQSVLEPGFAVTEMALTGSRVLLYDLSNVFIATAGGKKQFEGKIYESETIRSVVEVGRGSYRIGGEYGVDALSLR
ncbi:MAG: DUF5711 family protein [Lachnospiraceae bacterium]|nr:DUF5711 family protein [Lachnospiraceae bacterium]